MRAPNLVLFVLLVAMSAAAADPPQPPPTRAQVETLMGLLSEGDEVRGQLDTIGFVVTAEQAGQVVEAAVQLERASLAEQDARLGMKEGDGFIGGVCPHDDHLYAARAYVHLTERITAARVLLVGVFHRARLWGIENRLVFDSFASWHGPWGPVTVDPMRDELLGQMADASVLISNTMHCAEHSLEAIVPFLQHGHRDLKIVPILVPYATWDELQNLGDELSTAVARVMNRHQWQLGRDLAIVVSSDAVHYGPDFDHSPFGTDVAAYQKAVDRDQDLARRYLEGPLDAANLRALQYTLVDEENVRQYRLPWCGRFSVPFGLELLRAVAVKTGNPTPVGTLLRYGTSISEPELPVSAETKAAGLGYTAPSNLHHWVGYAAVGYTLPDENVER